MSFRRIALEFRFFDLSFSMFEVSVAQAILGTEEPAIVSANLPESTLTVISTYNSLK